MRLEVRETISQRPNGDRDTQTHPSSAFKVVLINGDKTSVVFKNDQFDAFASRIDGTRARYQNEAMTKANEIALTLGCPVTVQSEHDRKTDVLLAKIETDIHDLLKLSGKEHTVKFLMNKAARIEGSD